MDERDAFRLAAKDFATGIDRQIVQLSCHLGSIHDSAGRIGSAFMGLGDLLFQPMSDRISDGPGLTVEDLDKAKELLEARDRLDAAPVNAMPIRIVESRHMVEEYLLKLPRRHRKKNRVMKKWRRRWTRYRPSPDLIQFEIEGVRVIHCHPQMAEKLRAALKGIRRESVAPHSSAHAFAL